MIIEFFGLSNTGKSMLKRKLAEDGYEISKNDFSFFKKLFLFKKHLILHPITTFYLFVKLNFNHLKFDSSNLAKRFKIFRMRNSYLALVLAKYESLKNKTGNVFMDEFSFQSLFMIFQKQSNEQEIRRILKKLPKSNHLFLFEGKNEWRYKAYEKKHPKRKGTLLPGSGIDFEYAKKWMETMEYNFEIIKKVILKDFTKDKKTFKGLGLNYPEIYKRK